MSDELNNHLQKISNHDDSTVLINTENNNNMDLMLKSDSLLKNFLKIVKFLNLINLVKLNNYKLFNRNHILKK